MKPAEHRSQFHSWRRFIALGDSFTEGLCDELPGQPGRYRGWADRLATALDQSAAESFDYANLAIRGRLLEQIVAEQVPTAIRMRPDLVSLVGGANDLLRAKTDVDYLADRLERAVVLLRATGADVLLATPTDPGQDAILRRLRPRYAIYTSHIHSIGRRHGCPVVDLWGLTTLRDARMRAEDRLHLSLHGHRRVALAAAVTLGLNVAELQDVDPSWPRQHGTMSRLRGEARWVNDHVRPWVIRRITGQSSGDAIQPKRPDLGPLGE